MADPFTWVAIISAAVGAVGAIQQGNAASKSYKSQAQAQDYNAQVSKNQAQTALDVSAQEQLAHARKVNQVQGQQRAAVAQSGTGFGGSNADILEQSGTMFEQEALNLAYHGQTQAAGYTSQSVLDAYGASASRSNASAASTAGYLGAASSVLRGAGSVYQPTPKTVVGTGGNFYGLRPTSSGIGLRFG